MVLLIFVSAFLIRLVLSPFGSLPIDMGDWTGWSNRLVEVGFSKFYETWSDYLPGYLYVLWFLGHLKNFLYSLDLQIPLEMIYKFPAIIADIVLILVSYNIGKKFFSKKKALLVATIVAFNPAIFANSSLWGQIDVVNTLFYILTFLFLLQKRIMLAGISLAIALLIKPQGVILLPLIFLIIIKEKWKIADFLMGVAFSSFIFLGAFIPFSNKLNILQFIFESYSISLNQYQYTSVNAFNFWAIGQRWWKPDTQIWSGLPFQYWGMIIFAVFFGLILWNCWLKYKTSTLLGNLFIINFSAALIFLNSFIFLTRVHERLLLTPLVFLMLAAIFKKELWIFVAILSVTYIANLYFSFVWVTQNFRNIFSTNMINIISSLNVLVLVILLIILLKERSDIDKSKTI